MIHMITLIEVPELTASSLEMKTSCVWQCLDVRCCIVHVFLITYNFYVKISDTQEVKRIFSTFTNFGLAASMISVLLGIIPLYSYSLGTGGQAIIALFSLMDVWEV